MRGHRQDVHSVQNVQGVQGVLAHPYRALIAAFAAWKFFLVAVVAGSCIGDPYDTSAALAVLGSQDDFTRYPTLAGKLLTRFASWDAVYFVSVARRGYRFEQEWAFGTGLPIVIRGIVKALGQLGLVRETPGFGSPEAAHGPGSAVLETLAGVLVANTSHLLSAIVLYRLGLLVWRNRPQGALLSLLAALLHVISPAGLFLSAPYAESSFSLLSFLGYLLYAHSCVASKRASSDGFLVLAGLAFGLATAFRSNGILNGIPFAWEVLQLVPSLAKLPLSLTRKRDRGSQSTSAAAFSGTVRRLLALGVGGAAVAAGSLVPQAVAYQRYCSGTSGSAEHNLLPRRPWCQGYVPSIYTFVQEHYWNNGFLRYWTLSNLPLFLLAAPVLVILVRSGADYLSTTGATLRSRLAEVSAAESEKSARLATLVRSAAAAQLVLAVMVLTNSHVQIITRISSGYPLWYWWLAEGILRGESWGGRAVVFMIMYASIQGGLFASFLPPA